MEITIRHVLELSPRFEELLGRLVAGVAVQATAGAAREAVSAPSNPGGAHVASSNESNTDDSRPDVGTASAALDPAPGAASVPVDNCAEPDISLPPEPLDLPEGPARGEWRTAERFALLEKMYPAGVDLMEIKAVLAAVDGPPLPPHQNRIAHWARDRGLSRPSDGAEPWRTPARAAILKETWEAGVDVFEIAERMNALPGGPVLHRRLSVWAAQLNLKRPQEYIDRMARERMVRVQKARWGERPQDADQDTRAGVAGAAASVGPSTEAGGRPPAKAVEEDAGQDTDSRNESSVPPAPQPIGRPPNTGGEAVSVPAQASAELRPPAPPEPPSAAAPAPVRRAAPKLPPPDADGLIRASFREIKEWAEFYGIAYNGANGDAVNRRRALMGLRPVAQCEARTRAERQAA